MKDYDIFDPESKIYTDIWEKKQNEENNNLNENNEIEISTVQISEKIDEILSTQNFKELSLLKERLLAYKKEVDDKVKYNKPIEHELFKQNYKKRK